MKYKFSNFHLSISISCLLIILISCANAFNGFGSGVGDRVYQTSCTIVVGKLNQIYENVVTESRPMTYTFFVDRRYIQQSHQTTNLRVEVAAAQNATLQYPILFSVQQQRYINTLEVPRVFNDEDMTQSGRSKVSENLNKPFYSAGRTLCISGTLDPNQRGRNVTVRITTYSRSPQAFQLQLKLTQDFQLPLDTDITFDVSPTTPKFFGFFFSRPDIELVKIRASSDTSICMTISIQSIHCPIYDSVHNIRYKGLWQTMSTTAAMTVQKMGWYANGFVLVFVVHTDPRACKDRDDILVYGGSSNSSKYPPQHSFYGVSGGGSYQYPSPVFSHRDSVDPRSKRITLRITNESSISPAIIFLCLMLPIAVTFIISFVVLLSFRNRHEWMAKILKEKFGNNPCSASLIPSPGNDDGIDGDNSESRFKIKSDLFISKFRCKTFEEVERFSKRFCWTITIVAIFYSVPVYQLVVHYLRVLYRTGEYDICYYNYLCAHRIGLLIDFNHFWSNASYVIFGLFFIGIVRQRSLNMCPPQRWKPKKSDEVDNPRGCLCCYCCPSSDESTRSILLCGMRFTKVCYSWDHGVPGHFGVFYALGVALTMEGFLSAAYHLCPNQSTFQFDTCFMYVIAVLLILKIYQFRHPVHFGANQTFAILAGFVIFSVIGLLIERGTDKAILTFKIIFVVLQFVIMTILCIYYYAVGYIKDENGEQVTDISLFLYLGQLKSQRINWDRLILPLISFTICIAVVIYSELGSIGFASYLLYILVGNVLGTTLYYVGIMKPLHGEFKNRTWIQPTLYFIAAAVIGGFSMRFFVRAPAQWELSASASRAQNEECLKEWFPFHPFYDSHDAWHFLSAAALFLAFTGLLIVDDDLITTPQSQIHVF